MRYVGLFLIACVPAAVMVVAFVRATGVIGEVYEPHFASIASQVTSESVSSPWMASALVQVALFFKYLYLWLLPSTADMALDLRIDFAQYWAPSVALPVVLCYVTSGALAIYLILRRGRLALPAWGFLYVWILFAVEFTAVRFQEPFVLYRSYLWAPGIAVAVAAGRRPAAAALAAGAARAGARAAVHGRRTTGCGPSQRPGDLGGCGGEAAGGGSAWRLPDALRGGTRILVRRPSSGCRRC